MRSAFEREQIVEDLIKRGLSEYNKNIVLDILKKGDSYFLNMEEVIKPDMFSTILFNIQKATEIGMPLKYYKFYNLSYGDIILILSLLMKLYKIRKVKEAIKIGNLEETYLTFVKKEELFVMIDLADNYNMLGVPLADLRKDDLITAETINLYNKYKNVSRNTIQTLSSIIQREIVDEIKVETFTPDYIMICFNITNVYKASIISSFYNTLLNLKKKYNIELIYNNDDEVLEIDKLSNSVNLILSTMDYFNEFVDEMKLRLDKFISLGIYVTIPLMLFDNLSDDIKNSNDFKSHIRDNEYELTLYSNDKKMNRYLIDNQFIDILNYRILPLNSILNNEDYDFCCRKDLKKYIENLLDYLIDNKYDLDTLKRYGKSLLNIPTTELMVETFKKIIDNSEEVNIDSDFEISEDENIIITYSLVLASLCIELNKVNEDNDINNFINRIKDFLAKPFLQKSLVAINLKYVSKEYSNSLNNKKILKEFEKKENEVLHLNNEQNMNIDKLFNQVNFTSDREYFSNNSAIDILDKLDDYSDINDSLLENIENTGINLDYNVDDIFDDLETLDINDKLENSEMQNIFSKISLFNTGDKEYE